VPSAFSTSAGTPQRATTRASPAAASVAAGRRANRWNEAKPITVRSASRHPPSPSHSHPRRGRRRPQRLDRVRSAAPIRCILVASLALSRVDLDFLLYEWLDVESLTTRERYAQHSRATFDAVLELSERVSADHFAPHNRASDSHEPALDGGEI
jgi:hypothetical protein